MPLRIRKKPSAVRSPVTKGLSRSSTSLVISVAACASVLATTRVGTPHTSAASRAALSVLMCCPVGMSTFPPRWPHFFSDASWSSQCTAAAPATIMAFISSNALSTPPNPASASAMVGAHQGVVDPADHLRYRVDRVEALVRVGLPGQVGVRGDLPAGQVDRREAGPDLLYRLVAGQRAQRVHVVLGVQQRPQPLGAEPGQRVLFLHRAPQPDHVLG